MSVYRIDPLSDRRWASFVAENPHASIFHTPAWLEALRRTYGYEPLALTTSPPGRDLVNGLVFCHINSPLRGRRLVSLPFSDHCEPLINTIDDSKRLLSSLQYDLIKGMWKCIELRPLSTPPEGQIDFVKTKSFWFHKIDLQSSLDELFRRFHKSCVQRKVRHAERENMSYENGRSDLLLNKFYHLLLLTRREQELPPQPIKWFRNLINCLGDSLTIRVMSKDGHPIASILTLRHRDILVYKYGCSNRAFKRLGATQLLFWHAIQEATREGIRVFDLGRSDLDNHGLATFKDRLGSTRSELSYWGYPGGAFDTNSPWWTSRIAKRAIANAPNRILTTAAKFYGHFG